MTLDEGPAFGSDSPVTPHCRSRSLPEHQSGPSRQLCVAPVPTPAGGSSFGNLPLDFRRRALSESTEGFDLVGFSGDDEFVARVDHGLGNRVDEGFLLPFHPHNGDVVLGAHQ